MPASYLGDLTIERWQEKIISCQSSDSLESLRVNLLGKSGVLTSELKKLASLEPEKRRFEGEKLNKVKVTLSQLIKEKASAFEKEKLRHKLKTETLDLTLPCKPYSLGSQHILSQSIGLIKNYFWSLGFEAAEGPELETEFYNFDALNIPSYHPARQNHDTFYIKNNPHYLLRTHTSNAQIRSLENKKPPLRLFTIGRVYRSDAFDSTHSPMFHQIEGLVLEPNINMGHLKGCLIDFLRYFFGIPNLSARFRPSFFPFTEPSAEMDIGCKREKGGLILGGDNEWLEILGCGMVHPKVLENRESGPTQGFAFGVGLERLVMLKYGIPDIRSFYEGDSRWLKHYR